ncbi:hypothetical protein AMEX_G25307 [Astyanax mexicanus]|uniref:Uncharacterized protein n=1 Tax=Astyanax mexicanus TaxID=7994 RepID=A0A8T2KQV8_ASTMX|nr:hypothetical protein AMEX_G25307 [Astyanax mexicanus]
MRETEVPSAPELAVEDLQNEEALCFVTLPGCYFGLLFFSCQTSYMKVPWLGQPKSAGSGEHLCLQCIHHHCPLTLLQTDIFSMSA